MHDERSRYLPLLIAFPLTLLGCGGGGGADAAPIAAATFEETCSALLSMSVKGGSVTQAVYTPATAGPVDANSFPDHCLVRGSMNKRVGVDGKLYEIRFEVRLPKTWNKRYFYQGGAGVDGTLFVATGIYPGGGNPRNALLDGYAVSTTDSGHDGSQSRFGFGVDPQAREEYGYAQLPLVANAAKAIIAKTYGEGPWKSYFAGSSNGGRQAMVAAQRFPELFDGVSASSPGFRLAEAAIEGSIFRAQLAKAVSGDHMNPLTPAEKLVFQNKVLESCDAQDGVVDGMVGRPSLCRPDPMQWVCTQNGQANCLLAAKAQYVKTFFEGAKTATGRQVYSSWPYDPGMAGVLGTPSLAYYTVFAGEAALVYTSPPTVTDDLINYSLTADLDREFSKIDVTSGIYTQTGRQFTNAESPNMDAFKARGGKIMYLNGTADWAFSYTNLASYYDAVTARYGESNTLAFARYFVIPGMDHSRGGAFSTDRFDSFEALVNWVENGTAPDTIVATARADAGVAWPGRTRPLCVYPKEVMYKGSGSIELASSFVCQ